MNMTINHRDLDSRKNVKNLLEIFFEILKTESGKKASKITRYIITTAMLVYICPIILSMALCLIHPIGLLCILAIILSVFPFTKYILIPLIKKNFGIYK